MIVPATAENVARAAQALAAGELVAFPTETVYGLGADATNGRAVAAIFAAKGRPQFNPLIVHVKDRAAAEALAEFRPLARRLADAFWPGALTLVLPRRSDCLLSLLVSAGLDTVALRVPAHPIAMQLIKAADRPLAAPSANASGHVSPTRAAHVVEELGDRIDLVLDGGPTPLGIESTVVGFENGKPVLLRPGAVAREEIEKLIGALGAPANAAVNSPGQLANHYAPRARLRLNARGVEPNEALLAFGPDAMSGASTTLNLSAVGDLKEAATNLFAMLRKLDLETEAIAVMPIPNDGLGEAINDRLARAAAPRTP